jgi:hypothetical protein
VELEEAHQRWPYFGAVHKRYLLVNKCDMSAFLEPSSFSQNTPDLFKNSTKNNNILTRHSNGK